MTTPIRILHLEDNATDAELISAALVRSGLVATFTRVTTHAELAEMLERGGFALVMSDYNLPSFDGLSALRLVRERAPDVPFIFVSGALVEEAAVESLKNGATDYVLKHNLSRLGPAVHRALQEAADRAQRKQAEAALQASEAILASTQQIAHLGSWELDPASGGVHWSAETYRIFGVAPPGFVPDLAAILRLIPAGDYERVRRAMDDAIKSRQPFQLDHGVIRPDGEKRVVRCEGEPVLNARGEVVRLVGMVQDVTARVQEEQVRQRLEAQLRQAHKLEAIGTLAGGIAHDFNNILASIVMNAELCRMDLPAEHPAQEPLSAIFKASRRAKNLVAQILTFSRQREQERRQLHLQKIVPEALKLLRATLPATVEIRTELAADCPTVLADATQVHQIVMNLGTNAAHAMREQGGVLTVGLQAVTVEARLAMENSDLVPGPYLCLSVSDTGHGMSAATLEHIFEPFFTTKPLGEGTGLGLAVVHGIIKAHNGAVIVQSTPGQGTIFRLYFPESARPATETETIFIKTPRGDGEHVLFVDDEEPIALAGKMVLERLGYQVTVCSQPAEALARFRAQPDTFAAAVIDLTMPSIRGDQLASQMLQLRPGMPIILTTGNSTTVGVEWARSLGIREFLQKPATAQALGEIVHRVLEK